MTKKKVTYSPESQKIQDEAAKVREQLSGGGDSSKKSKKHAEHAKSKSSGSKVETQEPEQK